MNEKKDIQPLPAELSSIPDEDKDHLIIEARSIFRGIIVDNEIDSADSMRTWLRRFNRLSGRDPNEF